MVNIFTERENEETRRVGNPDFHHLHTCQRGHQLIFLDSFLSSAFQLLENVPLYIDLCYLVLFVLDGKKEHSSSCFAFVAQNNFISHTQFLLLI